MIDSVTGTDLFHIATTIAIGYVLLNLWSLRRNYVRKDK